MAKAVRRPTKQKPTPAEQVLDIPEASVLDVLDHVLTKGVLASGDVTAAEGAQVAGDLRQHVGFTLRGRLLPPGDPMVGSRPPGRRVRASAHRRKTRR